MQNVIQGEGCSNSHPANLGFLRREILAVLIGNLLFSKEEQLLANHQVHECEDLTRLRRWLHNVNQESERRERVAEARLQAAKRAGRCGADAPANELRYLTTCAGLTDVERMIAQQSQAHLSSPIQVISLVGQLYVKALKRCGKLNEDYLCE